jgi:hypothetical protein
MTVHMRDTRFSALHPSALSIPLERLILCVLHLPMRTHEQVLTMLFQQACQNRTSNKSKPILDDMVVIIRRLLERYMDVRVGEGRTVRRESKTTLGSI